MGPFSVLLFLLKSGETSSICLMYVVLIQGTLSNLLSLGVLAIILGSIQFSDWHRIFPTTPNDIRSYCSKRYFTRSIVRVRGRLIARLALWWYKLQRARRCCYRPGMLNLSPCLSLFLGLVFLGIIFIVVRSDKLEFVQGPAS